MLTTIDDLVNSLTNPANVETVYLEIRPEDALAPVVVAREYAPAAQYIMGLAAGSRPAQWSALLLVAGLLSAGRCSPLDLPWGQVGYLHTNAVRAWLVDHRAPATAKRILAAVRGVLKEAWRLQLMSSEAYHRAIDIKPIRGNAEQEMAGRYVQEGDVRALLAVCRADPTPAGVRDGVILGLAFYAGLRRAEIAGLRTEHVDLASKMIRVKGKGAKWRSVPVVEGLALAINEWLTTRSADLTMQSASPRAQRQESSGRDALPVQSASADLDPHLLWHIERGGHIKARGITPAGIRDIFARRVAEAGIRATAPHDGRRTWISNLLEVGGEVVVVQKLAGHQDPKTTAGYDRRGADVRARTINKLSMPWDEKKMAAP
ncbi:MAG: site-specific integrase [Caldilinea sp. CFX5]|nr:site-specific integrase [Caldilinea sp. CFX5]